MTVALFEIPRPSELIGQDSPSTETVSADHPTHGKTKPNLDNQDHCRVHSAARLHSSLLVVAWGFDLNRERGKLR